MKLELPPGTLLDKAQKVARAASEQGGRALLVGGWVRDALLGLQPKDADLEVYGIPAEDLRKLLGRFGRVGCVGESFRVYKLTWNAGGERWELDVSLPRRDKKTGEGHRGFEVEGDPHASVHDAARRRDFTINAILCDPLSGEILDPFNGRADLEKKILRVVDAKHFAEDSLRVLRAMQFAARFELTIEPATLELCRSIDLSDLPRERIWGEWEKMLVKSQRPSLGLLAARELGVLEKLFPFLESAMRRKRAPLLGKVLDNAAREREFLSSERGVTLMLAAVGLALGESDFAAWLEMLGIFSMNNYDVRDNALKTRAGDGQVRLAWKYRVLHGDAFFRRLSLRCEPALPFHLARAQGDGEAAQWFKAKMESLDVWLAPPAPLLLGRHLIEMGLKPGPQFGEITRAVYEKQLDGDVTNLEEARAAAQAILKSTP